MEDEIEDNVKVDPDKAINREMLEKLLRTLPDEQREIVVLRYIEEFSMKEIAKIVDKSPGHVRVIIHRSIKELRKYI